MCGSPRSLPRAPNCDTGPPQHLQCWLLSSTPTSQLTQSLLSQCPLLPLWPSKHLMSGTLNPSPKRRGPDQGTSSAHSGPPFDFYQ